MITDRRKFQNHSPGLYAPYKERTSHIFGNVRYPILGKPRTPLQLPGCRRGKKQTELETENKNTADSAGITQSQERDTRYRRMPELHSLCVSK